jgi:hypothetical protein
MYSDNDLPHKQDTLQKPPLMKKKGNPIWKVVFILLLTVNVIFDSWALIETMYGYHGPTKLTGLFLFIQSLPISITELIVLLFYSFIRRPHGISRVIISTVLISLPLTFVSVLYIIVPIIMYFGVFFFNIVITY